LKKKIEEKVEKVEEKVEGKKDEEMCDECESFPASKWCADCDSKQCEKCADQLHQVKKRKGHVVVSIYEKSQVIATEKKKDVPEDKSGRCVTHPEEKIVAYCKSCDEPICAVCMLKKHDGHQKLDLITAKTQVSSEYDNMLKEIKTSNENINLFHQGLNENNKVCNEEIKKYFETIRNVLNKKEELLLQKVKEFHSSNEIKLQEEEELLKKVEFKRWKQNKTLLNNLNLKLMLNWK